MARPVTLFTGQWADLPLEQLAAKAGDWGFDGLELACWGDHFEVDKALADPDYTGSVQEVLERNPANRQRFLSMDRQEFIEEMDRWMLAYCPCDDSLVPGLDDDDVAFIEGRT